MTWMSKTLITAGMVLLVPATIWLFGGMMGLLQTDVISINGQSGLRTLAAIAVMGCLLSATGCWQQEKRRNK